MSSFEGFLESVSLEGDVLIARVVAGDFDPFPASPPVFVVTVEHPVDPASALADLLRAKETDGGVYVSLLSETEAYFQTDHGHEITVHGNRVFAEAAQYEGKDFERLARLNHDWGKSQYKALRSTIERLNTVRDLVREQHARTLVKAQRHEPGSTARTLYEQQLSFLARLLGEADA
jgi:hypothetical protein